MKEHSIPFFEITALGVQEKDRVPFEADRSLYRGSEGLFAHIQETVGILLSDRRAMAGYRLVHSHLQENIYLLLQYETDGIPPIDGGQQTDRAFDQKIAAEMVNCLMLKDIAELVRRDRYVSREQNAGSLPVEQRGHIQSLQFYDAEHILMSISGADMLQRLPVFYVIRAVPAILEDIVPGMPIVADIEHEPDHNAYRPQEFQHDPIGYLDIKEQPTGSLEVKQEPGNDLGRVDVDRKREFIGKHKPEDSQSRKERQQLVSGICHNIFVEEYQSHKNDKDITGQYGHKYS